MSSAVSGPQAAQDLDYYEAVPYLLVVESVERGGEWLCCAAYPELPGCVAEATSAVEAIERLDGYEFKGRSLRVNAAEERRPRSPAFADTGSFGMPRGRGEFKRKGSRRNIRARKRSL